MGRMVTSITYICDGRIDVDMTSFLRHVPAASPTATELTVGNVLKCIGQPRIIFHNFMLILNWVIFLNFKKYDIFNATHVVNCGENAEDISLYFTRALFNYKVTYL